jgi:hypothetical protein
VDTENSSVQPKPSMAHVAGAFRGPSGDSEVVVFGGCTSSCCFGEDHLALPYLISSYQHEPPINPPCYSSHDAHFY